MFYDVAHFSDHPDALKKGGFALVIALSLMSFVLLLILSLSILVQVEHRAAENAIHQLKARQNALLGLQIALGELQAAGGPDQRVTARADILEEDVPNPEWTGVWRTFNDESDETRLWPLEDIRNWSVVEEGPRWLVSSSQGGGASLDPALSADDPANNPAIAGYGGSPVLRMGVRADGADVWAGKIPLREREDGFVRGMFAWWVGDEGVKAKVNLPDHHQEITPGMQDPDWYHRQLNFLTPAQVGWAQTELFDADNLERDHGAARSPDDLSAVEWLRIASAGGLEVALGVRSDSDFLPKLEPDFSLHSLGVLSDVRHGGLKKDLTRGLDDQFPTTLAGEPIHWRHVPESPTRIVWGGHWDVLYDYYNQFRPRLPFIPYVQPTESGYRPLLYRPNPGDDGPWGLGAYNGRNASDPGAAMVTRWFGPHQEANRGGSHDAGTGATVAFNPQRSAAGHLNRPFYRGVDQTFNLHGLGGSATAPIWNAVSPVLLREFVGLAVTTYDLRQFSAIYTTDRGYPVDDDQPYRLVFTIRPGAVVWNPYNTPLVLNHLSMRITTYTEVTVTTRLGDGSSRTLELQIGDDPQTRLRHFALPYHTLPDGNPNDNSAPLILEPGEIKVVYLANSSTTEPSHMVRLFDGSKYGYAPEAAVMTNGNGVRRVEDPGLRLAPDEVVESVTVLSRPFPTPPGAHYSHHIDYARSTGLNAGPYPGGDPRQNVYPGGYSHRLMFMENFKGGPSAENNASAPFTFAVPGQKTAEEMVMPVNDHGIARLNHPDFPTPEDPFCFYVW